MFWRNFFGQNFQNLVHQLQPRFVVLTLGFSDEMVDPQVTAGAQGLVLLRRDVLEVQNVMQRSLRDHRIIGTLGEPEEIEIAHLVSERHLLARGRFLRGFYRLGSDIIPRKLSQIPPSRTSVRPGLRRN